MVNAEHVGGTRDSAIMSSTTDMIWIGVVRGMRGVGGVCEMCLARDGEESEWMRGFGLED